MKSKFKERTAYKLDNFMAKGPKSLFLALLIVFLGGFLLLSLLRVIAGLYVVDDADRGQ